MANTGWTVSAVASRLGVAPATLRTWDRRYGIGPSAHSAGSHRRYTTDDIKRLEHMRQLILSGMSPGDAARTCTGDVIEEGGRHGGGNVIPLPQSEGSVRGLARAATALDGDACAAIVRESLDSHGVAWTWEKLVTPVLVGLGKKWETQGTGIDAEHVLSNAIQPALIGYMATCQISLPGTVLLACAPEELHSLPVWATAAALAERGVPTRVLGARVPARAIAHAMSVTRPAGVFVWSSMPATGDPATLNDLPSLRPAPTIMAAGPGWQDPLPEHVIRIASLTEAVTRLTRVGGEASSL